MSEKDGDTSSSSFKTGINFLVNFLAAPSKTNKHVSVLFLTPQWRLDSCGTSSITRSLIKNLRDVDPEANFIRITCALLEEEGLIEPIREAADLKVQLKGYIHPRGSKKKADLQWLNEYAINYYQYVVSETKYDFIIAHTPYFTNGCLNLRDSSRDRGHTPKVILITYELPQLDNGDTDEMLLRVWLCEAEAVFSIGKSIRDEIARQIAMLSRIAEKVPQHKSYIPGFPIEIFEIQREARMECDSKAKTKITMITPMKKDDFSLGVNSVARACNGSVQATLTMLSENSDEEEWVREIRSLKIANQNLKHHTIKDRDELKHYMKKSNLFLFPLKSSSSSLFCEEALAAIAAGVPVLVSSHSVVGSFLLEIGEDSVVDVVSEQSWTERIRQKINEPVLSQEKAKELRERLLLDTRIPSTHQDFTKLISETACIELEMKMSTHSSISDTAINIVKKIGAKDSNDLHNPKGYMIAFLKQILLLRDKLEIGLLQSYLTEAVETRYQKLFRSMDKDGCKILSVQSDF